MIMVCFFVSAHDSSGKAFSEFSMEGALYSVEKDISLLCSFISTYRYCTSLSITTAPAQLIGVSDGLVDGSHAPGCCLFWTSDIVLLLECNICNRLQSPCKIIYWKCVDGIVVQKAKGSFELLSIGTNGCFEMRGYDLL